MFTDIVNSAANVVAGVLSKKGQDQANRENERIARENREWQERMSSTAYQRAMADMKSAGLNPMLAYMQGGATTPSGSTAQMQDSITPGLNSAMASRRLVADLHNLEASNEKIKADTLLSQAQAQQAAATAKATEATIPKKEILSKPYAAAKDVIDNTSISLADKPKEERTGWSAWNPFHLKIYKRSDYESK
jgi:hypothetical protein